MYNSSFGLENKKDIIDDYFIDYINSTPISNRTKKMYISTYTKFWKQKIGELEFLELTYDVIQNNLIKLATKYSYGTLKVYKSSVMKFYTVAKMKGKNVNYINNNYIKIGRPSAKKDYLIKENEFKQLLIHLEKSRSRNKDEYIMLIWLGYYTGLRISEALALNRKNIDLGKGTIEIKHSITTSVVNGKEVAILSCVKTSSSERTVYMCTKLKEILSNYLKKLEGDILFSDNNNNYIIPSRVSNYISNYAKPRGYTLYYHLFRVMFVKKMVDKGINLEIVRCLIGHKSVISVIDVYFRTTIEERKKAVLKVFG